METLLAWHTLVFYVPVAFGALLALSAAFGLAGGGAGHGALSHGGPFDGPDSDSLLGLGRLPLALRLMLLAFSFGGVGLVVGPLIHAITPGPPAVGGALSVVAATIGAGVISGATARLIARRLPLFESETIRRAELVGCSGRLVLAASVKSGVVQVRDRRGNLHQVGCCLPPGEPALPAGSEVLLVEYDETTNVFVAVKFAAELR